MGIFQTKRSIERDRKDRELLRALGTLPPPPCIIQPVKRSNSWQARMRLRNSVRRDK